MQDQKSPIGILLMAYGTPETPADVEAYFTHIRGGKTPPPDRVEHLKRVARPVERLAAVLVFAPVGQRR